LNRASSVVNGAPPDRFENAQRRGRREAAVVDQEHLLFRSDPSHARFYATLVDEAFQNA
jgi:hypothetical protein